MTTMIPLLVLAFAVLAAVPLLRHQDRLRRARGLRRAGFGWLAAFGVLGGLFIAGETFSDPGGLEAAGMVVAWLVPVLALSALAWWRPAAAQPVLVVLVVVVLAYCAWSVWGGTGSRQFRDQNGPYDAIAVFVASVALGTLGLHRPRVSGLLLATSLLPVAFMAMGSEAPFSQAFSGSLGAAALPGLVSAGLFLLADREAKHQPSPTRTKLPAPPR